MKRNVLVLGAVALAMGLAAAAIAAPQSKEEKKATAPPTVAPSPKQVAAAKAAFADVYKVLCHLDAETAIPSVTGPCKPTPEFRTP